MNVLVTGGAGYIGSHVCKALAREGYTPVTCDNLVNGHEWAVKWGQLERGDILDRGRLDEVIKKYQPVAVMHFAAFIAAGESVECPGKYYRNNVIGSLTLLEALRDHSIDKIIFSSTAAIFGDPQFVPVSETHIQQPINPYGMTKMIIERMLSDYDRAHGLRSISLRYFNAAGADPDGEIGEDHNQETHLIPLVLDTASGNRDSITIYGNDYDTPDGICIRDYIHVTDIGEAHILALRALESGASTNVFNLGNGRGFSVKEVIDTAIKITNKKFKVNIGARRPDDPASLISTSDKIRSELGWQPHYADLSLIIQSAWNWAKK